MTLKCSIMHFLNTKSFYSLTPIVNHIYTSILQASHQLNADLSQPFFSEPTLINAQRRGRALEQKLVSGSAPLAAGWRGITPEKFWDRICKIQQSSAFFAVAWFAIPSTMMRVQQFVRVLKHRLLTHTKLEQRLHDRPAAKNWHIILLHQIPIHTAYAIHQKSLYYTVGPTCQNNELILTNAQICSHIILSLHTCTLLNYVICTWHVTTTWVRCSLWVSQPGQLGLPSLQGLANE